MRFERIVGRPRKTVTRSGGWRKPAPAAPRLDDTAPPAPAARREGTHVRPGSYIALSLLVSALFFALFLTGDRGFLKVREQRQIKLPSRHCRQLEQRHGFTWDLA